MKKHKSLTSQTLITERIKLKFSKELIWWHIIDVSDLKIAQDFLSEAKLNFKISSTLNIEKSVDDWIVLRPTAERCLQFLSKLNSYELHKIGELVKPKGIYGVIVELMRMELNEKSNPESNLFDNDNKNLWLFLLKKMIT